MKVSEFISKFITDSLNVKCVFFMSGAGNLSLIDSLSRSKNLQLICNHHEQACSMAACASARETGNIGIALVTTGPGGTNAITGVCSAWVDSIPMIMISGQVNYKDTIEYKYQNIKHDNYFAPVKIRQNGVQEINIIDIVKSITKYAKLISDKNEILYELEKAVFLAKSGRRGPVWLDIPINIQDSEIDENNLRKFPINEMEYFSYSKNDFNINCKNNINKIIDLIKKSERPVIIGGYGVKTSDNGIQLFKQIIKKLNIPVLITWKAIDLVDENEPTYIGRFGIYGQRAANFCVQNSDLIISIGSRLSIPQTGYNYNDFARNAKKIVIDIDKNELFKFNQKPEVLVHSDAETFLSIFNSSINGIRTNSKWLKHCNTLKNKYPVVLPEYKNTKKVNSFVFIDSLSDLLLKDDIIVPGASGTAFTCTHQAFKVKYGQKIFTSNGFAEMGFDLPGAIGAAVSSGKRIILVTGDGSIQMNIHELQTIMNYNLPIKIFCYNNKGYLTIRHSQANAYNGNYVGSGYSSGVKLPDLEKIAYSYGIKYRKISNQKNLKNNIKNVLNIDGPVLCEIIMDENQLLIPKLSFRKINNKLISMPLEDLFPFLERKEFNENMLIPKHINSIYE